MLQSRVNKTKYQSNAVLKEWFWGSTHSALVVRDASHSLTSIFLLAVDLLHFQVVPFALGRMLFYCLAKIRKFLDGKATEHVLEVYPENREPWVRCQERTGDCNRYFLTCHKSTPK